eukprot:UN14968
MAKGGWKKWVIIFLIQGLTHAIRSILDLKTLRHHVAIGLSQTLFIFIICVLTTEKLRYVIGNFVKELDYSITENDLQDRLIMPEEEYRKNYYSKNFMCGSPQSHILLFRFTLIWLSTQFVFFELVYQDADWYYHLTMFFICF